MGVRQGWRWFRRRPVALQAAAWILLAAAYSWALLAVLPGDDGRAPTSDSAERRPPRPLSPLERRVSSMVESISVKAKEVGDVRGFRAPRNAAVRCNGDRCEIRYAVGLPGRGRILEDQRQLWESLFRETDVQKAKVDVVRDQASAGVPPKEGEETVSGQIIMTTTCDRSDRPDVDWSRRSGTQILTSVCRVSYDAGKGPQTQEPVDPGDPSASDARPGKARDSR